ncbi:hypothetical protein ACFP63_01610 [Oerskovia jenensis]
MALSADGVGTCVGTGVGTAPGSGASAAGSTDVPVAPGSLSTAATATDPLATSAKATVAATATLNTPDLRRDAADRFVETRVLFIILLLSGATNRRNRRGILTTATHR